MRIVLADLKGSGGQVNKDTVAGGYGSRFQGTSVTTKIIEIIRKIYQNFPSIHTAYLAAILLDAGHEVHFTRDPVVPGDVALVLTTIVDYRHERDWAARFRKLYGSPVGFYGTMATHVDAPLAEYGDFIIKGEPEQAVMRLASGENLKGSVTSPPIRDLDSLPFPNWGGATQRLRSYSAHRSPYPTTAIFPVLSSRSCPEFCTYCPHRITAPYRSRTPENVVREIEYLCESYGAIDLIFRDPLFTEERRRSTAIAKLMIQKRLPVHFECETRLDDLDIQLIDVLYRAGLRSLAFGVESMDPATLKKVGRRPIPTDHQKNIISHCSQKGIRTNGFYVLGFLQDTADSIRATIQYAIDLDSTTAGFKILTPYPGTPLRKQIDSLVTETDLEKFDGFTPTFTHPNLTHAQLKYLLNSAYARFYFRPSWGLNYFGIKRLFENSVARWDAVAKRKHDESDLKAGFAPLNELTRQAI